MKAYHILIIFLLIVISFFVALYQDTYSQKNELIEKYDSLELKYKNDIHDKDSVINFYNTIINEQTRIINSIKFKEF